MTKKAPKCRPYAMTPERQAKIDERKKANEAKEVEPEPEPEVAEEVAQRVRNMVYASTLEISSK